MKFVFMLILIAHWSGCFFFFLMQIESEYGHGTWLEHNVGHIQEGENLTGRYLTALYSGFLMLIGEGMDMETNLETFYGSLMVLVGTIVTAVIVGNVSFVVSNQNSTSFQYQSKIDMITDEMRALHLPSELQDRTLAYYDYLWNRHRTFDPQMDRFTTDLSPTLRQEILLHMNRDCILNCNFFRDVSNDCIIKLVHSFKFAVYLECDILAAEGEIAESLVFLIHGSAKVTKIGRIMPVSLLKPGDYFGKAFVNVCCVCVLCVWSVCYCGVVWCMCCVLSLGSPICDCFYFLFFALFATTVMLYLCTLCATGEKSLLMHHRNAVSVVATENCDTRVLGRFDFEELSLDFPELKDSIMKRSDHMDITEYDSHTKRKTLAMARKNGGKNSSGNLPGLTPQQQSVMNDLNNGVDVEDIKSFVMGDKSSGRADGKGKSGNVTREEKRLIEMLSTVSAISTEVDLLSRKAGQREEDSNRMFMKQQQLENQMFSLNQNMSKILELMQSRQGGGKSTSGSGTLL